MFRYCFVSPKASGKDSFVVVLCRGCFISPKVSDKDKYYLMHSKQRCSYLFVFLYLFVYPSLL